jgi:hypothetical protein
MVRGRDWGILPAKRRAVLTIAAFAITISQVPYWEIST